VRKRSKLAVDAGVKFRSRIGCSLSSYGGGGQAYLETGGPALLTQSEARQRDRGSEEADLRRAPIFRRWRGRAGIPAVEVEDRAVAATDWLFWMNLIAAGVIWDWAPVI
jgi:hypothetical protein